MLLPDQLIHRNLNNDKILLMSENEREAMLATEKFV
jgi:hypothetical protein